MNTKDQDCSSTLAVLKGYSAYVPKVIVDRRWPWTWVRRACHWILDRIGIEDSRVEIVEVRFDSVMELIMEQRLAVEHIFHRQCRWVIMGHKQMAQLGVEDTGQIWFNLPLDYRYLGAGHPLNFAGLNIVLVPWFDGVLCLQELP